jgi:cytoplasmic iron level regulating protein YaaA (DUF328/UPF0246 family)
MIILSSPAKSLDYESEYKSPFATQPHFLKETAQLAEVLKKTSAKKLAKILEVSQNLADLNYERFQEWEEKKNKDGRPAIFAYNGDVYAQLHPDKYTKSQAEYLQHSMRIISGFYGILKPYDLIQPYRLEMQAVFKIKKAKNLYQFWGESLTEYLNYEIEANNHKHVVNVASGEYIKAIHTDKLHATYIDIQFNQKVKGKLTNIGFVSKKARGMMIDYLASKQANTLEDIKGFDREGYKLHKEEKNLLLFVKS